VCSEFDQEHEKNEIADEARRILAGTGHVGGALHAGALTLMFGLFNVSTYMEFDV